MSNTPELCMNWETYNKVSGTTRNPYDTRRTPAGSSGGEVFKEQYIVQRMLFWSIIHEMKVRSTHSCG